MAVKEYKFHPTEESLLSKTHIFTCPVEKCNKQVNSAAALSKHLQSCIKQTQNGNTLSKDVSFVLQYHCPILGCLYNSILGRYFTCLKYLKQHYEKVHAVKNLKCEKCNEAFSRQCYLNTHVRQCGLEFICSCGMKYFSREALLTHAKRNQHKLLNDNCSKPKTHCKIVTPPTQENCTLKNNPVIQVLQPSVTNISSENKLNLKSKPRLLLPKAAPLSSIPLPTLAALALSELSGVKADPTKIDASTQANFKNSSGHCNVCYNNVNRLSKSIKKFLSHTKCSGSSLKRPVFETSVFDQTDDLYSQKRPRRSAETQTKGIIMGKRTKRQKACAETQTLESRLLAALERNASASKLKKYSNSKQSIHTQTANVVASIENYYPQADFLQNFGQDKAEIMNDQYLNLKTQNESSGLLSNFEIKNHSSAGNQVSSTYAQTYNLPTERNTSSTQTQDSLQHRQCSSSQTEKDVFLGHMADIFNMDKPFLTMQESHLSAFSPSDSLTSSQNTEMSSTCTADMSYNHLFSPEPCGCDKINEIRVYSIETQTELNLDCLFMCGNDECDDQSDDILCFNIETQTSDDLQSLPYEQLLSNMQTQTTEDYLFPELNFTDIQTQTASIGGTTVHSNHLHELVHIQTQTNADGTNSQSTNIETQTFTQLESCAELIDSHTQTTWSCLQELVSGL